MRTAYLCMNAKHVEEFVGHSLQKGERFTMDGSDWIVHGFYGDWVELSVLSLSNEEDREWDT